MGKRKGFGRWDDGRIMGYNPTYKTVYNLNQSHLYYQVLPLTNGIFYSYKLQRNCFYSENKKIHKLVAGI